MIGRVLVSADRLDDGSAESAIAAAAELARAYDAELVVLDQASPPDLRQVLEPEAARSEVEDHLARVVNRVHGVRTRLRKAASGDPVKTVLNVAIEEKADVVVVANLVNVGVASEETEVPANASVEKRAARENPETAAPAGARPTRSHGVFRSFYGETLGWASLFLTSFLLAYGGGAVMFWLHAIYRGERGPAISDWSHWLLDSTLGFVALTPVLFFILPAALWVLTRGDGSRRLGLWSYVAVVATAFTLVTGPGPLLHNSIAGHGTWLADLATRVFGHDSQIAERNMHAMEHSHLTEGVLQIAVGFPVYVALAWLALRLVKAMTRRGVERHAKDEGVRAGSART